jgi:hypothetical protein
MMWQEGSHFFTPIFNFSVDCPNKDMLLSPFEATMFFATAFHIVGNCHRMVIFQENEWKKNKTQSYSILHQTRLIMSTCK